MDDRIKRINQSLEDMQSSLQSVIQEKDKLGNDVAILKEQVHTLMAGHATLEKRESDVEERVQNLELTSNRLDFRAVEEFRQG